MLRPIWTRQPQSPVRIRRGNSLGRRVIWLALGSAWAHDLASGAATSMQASGALKATKAGRAFVFPGTGVSGYYNYTLTAPTSNVGTFFLIASRIGSPDTSGMVMWGTNTTNSVYFQLPSTVGKTAYCFGQAITNVDPAVLLTNTVDKTIVMTSDGTAAGKKLYIDGVLRGTADATTPTSFAAGAKSFRFGSWVGAGAFNCDMDCEMAGFTPDVWDAQAVHAFMDNPWQILAPQPRIFVAPTVSAGNTIAVPAGSLTLTAQTPTVVATANQRIAVPAGSLTLTGKVPTVTATANQTIRVPLATLTLTALAPTVLGSTAAAMPVGGVSARVWRQGIQTYLRRLEAESEPEVRAEIKQVKRQAKKAIELVRDTGTLPPIPKLTVEAPDLQFLVERANAEILAKAEAELRALEDEEDAIYVLLH